MNLNKVPYRVLVYFSHYYVVEGEVIKSYNENPEDVTPERVQELIKQHRNIIVQEGNQINMYFNHTRSIREIAEMLSRIVEAKRFNVTLSLKALEE